MTKYKIIISEGCTAFYTTVNDKLTYGEGVSVMSDDERKEFLEYLLVKIREGVEDNTIDLNTVINIFQYDEWEQDDDTCEQCGDSVNRTIWNL